MPQLEASEESRTTEKQLRDVLRSVLNFAQIVRNELSAKDRDIPALIGMAARVDAKLQDGLALPPGLEETLAGLPDEWSFRLIIVEEHVYTPNIENEFIYLNGLAPAIRELTEATDADD